MQKNQIKCPKCGEIIAIEDVLSQQIEDSLKTEYNKKWQASKTELEEQARKKLQEEYAARQELQAKELEDKSTKLKEMYALQAEFEKMKREKDEMKAQITLEKEKEFSERLGQVKENASKLAKEEQELKIKELQKQLEDQKKLTEEMKRKQEQGSMQLQGEVQELAIEEWLRQRFPLDTISEIGKGARGADCIQIVNTREHINCGTIYYESKRTKEFSPSWIEKFREDIRSQNATIGVLVTDVYPKGVERMELRDGIWICSFEEFKGLCFVLRENIIAIHQLSLTQENKGDKMAMLYNYLTGQEFKSQVEAIIEGFTEMQADLNKEKTAMQSIWKKREKQIEKVIMNTGGMYSSIKGIGGSSIPQLSGGDIGLLENIAAI